MRRKRNEHPQITSQEDTERKVGTSLVHDQRGKKYRKESVVGSPGIMSSGKNKKQKTVHSQKRS